MPDLFLVRHCEPAVTGVLLGQSDPPLSDRGRADALNLLRHRKLNIIYSSPLRRALETAQAIGGPIEIVHDLREITYGEWDGLTWAQIEATDPLLAAAKLRDWQNVTPPGGETWDQFTSRVRHALQHILNGPRPAAIVAHAAVNKVIAGVDQAYGQIYEF
jgi:broad specificity phosphatase PhoE